MPLLLYVVGVESPHVAIGTSALAVSVNAFANLIAHARAGNVKWPCAVVFGLSGVTGAFAGATLGKLVDGQQLLFLFALVMVAVAAAMLRPKAAEGDPAMRINPAIAERLPLVQRLAQHKGVLNRVFAALVFAVAAYMLYRTALA